MRRLLHDSLGVKDTITIRASGSFTSVQGLRMPSVFLSHSSKDKEFVRHLAGELIREEITVWLDEVELRVGDNLSGIESSIRASDYLVVVLSKAAVESGWVEREIEVARNVG